MQYYKVKKESDNIKTGNSWFFVANELLTENDIKKRKLNKYMVDLHCTPINISKFNTYFFFGARFQK